jgi:hypothetical protein
LSLDLLGFHGGQRHLNEVEDLRVHNGAQFIIRLVVVLCGTGAAMGIVRSLEVCPLIGAK